MASLRFCANISWLFTELPDFSQRMYAAASAGFQSVEAAWLYDSDLSELQRAREATGVEVALINTPPGKQRSMSTVWFIQCVRVSTDSFNVEILVTILYTGNNMCVSVYAAGDVKAGDLGLGAVPGREAEFRQGLDLALKYAKALGCQR